MGKEEYARNGQKESRKKVRKKWRQSHKKELKVIHKNWVKKNPKRWKEIQENGRLKFLYGITLKKKQEDYIVQNGCCKICKKPLEWKEIKTDHNHQTGEYRGLLCASCNLFVGFFDNYPDLVPVIEEYVK